MLRAAAPALGLTLLIACAGVASPGPRTGITGTVVRGPIAPTCQVGTPCQAPFGARFSVRQGTAVVAAFRSDSAGRFTVYVAPGRYTVSPDSGGAIMQRQSLPVVVEAAGLTTVRLAFDTGIR